MMLIETAAVGVRRRSTEGGRLQLAAGEAQGRAMLTTGTGASVAQVVSHFIALHQPWQRTKRQLVSPAVFVARAFR